MFAFVVFSLMASLAGCSVVALFAVTDVALAGPPVPRRSSDTIWRPPLAPGRELWKWAARQAKATAAHVLAQPRGRKTASRLVDAIFKGTASVMDRTPGIVPQAEPNCSNCRHQMIRVTPPEALALVEAIRRTRPRVEAQRVQDLATRNAKRVEKMNSQEYERAQVTCPLFAANAACIAFDSRPVSCRGWCLHSGEDGDRCLLAEEPVSTTHRSREKEMDSRALSVGRGIEEGLSQGILSAGLDGHLYELNSALTTAFTVPDAAGRWADGEPVFQTCKRYA